VPDFSRRSNERELMDRADIGFAEFHHCLQSLATINALTLAYRPTLTWLQPWLESGERLHIVDVGSGGGDMLRRISARRAKIRKQSKQSGLHDSLDLMGVDLNPWSQRSAELCNSNVRIRHITTDVFNFQPKWPVDLVISNLFTHHLSESRLVQFLQWMDRHARKGWFINDLHRHALPYYGIKLATRLFSRNLLIRNDAPVSVARAFTKPDWQRLLLHAGIESDVRIRRYFPFRLCLYCNTWG
jgi:hypothetical protein